MSVLRRFGVSVAMVGSLACAESSVSERGDAGPSVPTEITRCDDPALWAAPVGRPESLAGFPSVGAVQIDLLEVVTIGMLYPPGCVRATESSVPGVGAGDAWRVDARRDDPWTYDPGRLVIGIGAGQSLSLVGRELADGALVEERQTEPTRVRAPESPFFEIDGLVSELRVGSARVGDVLHGIATEPGGAPYLTYRADVSSFEAARSAWYEEILTVTRTGGALAVEVRSVADDGSSTVIRSVDVPDGGDPIAFLGSTMLATGAEIHRIDVERHGEDVVDLSAEHVATLPGPLVDHGTAPASFGELLLAGGRVLLLVGNSFVPVIQPLEVTALTPTEIVEGGAISDGARFVRVSLVWYGGGELDAGPPTIVATVEPTAHPFPTAIGRPLALRQDGSIVGERGMAGAVDQDAGATFVALPAALGEEIIGAADHLWATRGPDGRTRVFATVLAPPGG